MRSFVSEEAVAGSHGTSVQLVEDFDCLDAFTINADTRTYNLSLPEELLVSL